MKLALFGCGNMARALVGPMLISGIDLIGYDPIFDKAQELAGDGAIESLGDLPQADLYLIACKPQQFSELAESLNLEGDATVISIMAGVSVEKIQKSLGVKSVVRVMPNTPALVGEGVNAIYFSPEVEQAEVEVIENLFQSGSEVFVFPREESIDIITGFSGSGPAYIFEIAHIMIDKLVSMGVTKKSSNLMIKQTILGAAKLMVESENSPEELRNMVTSKKGVTFEALEVFKKNDLEGIFGKALDAAYKRSKEISKG